MFGYNSDASTQVLAARRAERGPAHERWPFMTSLDMSAVHNELQLAELIKDRRSVSLAAAEADVSAWLAGYRQRMTAADDAAMTAGDGARA
jgi:hypothetical protein